ncbi:MAG: Ldh family oxidoreductase, partial [Pseudomonadota bacterium]|nr:Ldh family oxidoreductase [Pseudomonadota bacterium]
MDAKVKKYNHKEVSTFSQAVFQYYGVNEKSARIWSDVLVWANLRGVDSHGILRIPTYVEYLKTNIINVNPDIHIDLLNGAAARMDADLAPGPVALDLAMQTSIKKANEFNVGWCAVSELTHAGAVGYFALKAARIDMIGI